MSILAVFQLVLLVWLAFAFTLGAAASLVRPLIERKTRDWALESSYRAVFLLALSPVVLATVALVAVMSPSVLALVWPNFDHCLVHPGHLHLCLVHLPERWASPALLAALTVVATFLAGRAMLGLRDLARGFRLGSRLVARATGRKGEALVLPTAEPMCLLVGLLRPSILLSQGLLCAVSGSELEAIMSHERAHAERRDTLARLLARVSTVFMFPASRRALLDSLELAQEQRSDEVGAVVLGDRLAMAEVILKVERLLHVCRPAMHSVAMSFGGSSVPRRVVALLQGRRGKRSRLPGRVVAAIVVALLVSGPELHHATETLLGLVIH